MQHRSPEQAASPAGGAAADERARAAGTADPGAAGDVHVAGPPPAPAECDPAEDTSPDPVPAAGLAEDEVATGFPSPAPGGARPGLHPTPAGLGGVPERLFDPADAERFRQRWHEVQSGFVDDPAESVRAADALAAEAVEALSRSAGTHRRALSDEAARHGAPDTERLRLALRGYRDLLERIFAA
ncbi:hypothetical protein F8568_043655 [Actinomadura sp. LD22]|uniref:Uncharacterized protein n=1 Tax=Actinomadura physcomitrii TaxID=2650748 RepID=A0A6I4MSM3_9ACTN|nr:hypothetical protein [Actinomadura physcomitrii]MWA05296.1 hypothetical protein [Actinomadura physcomitrii]MWA07121.1 hypothetical protein [Actinomadura physcomitrii]